MAANASPFQRPELDAVLAPLAEALPLPRRAYVDPEVFAFERDAIFGRAWMCVGHASDVALPGQWIRIEVAGEPIVVVRGVDLKLRAFYDVCRHRGAPIVDGESGRLARFVCPYHRWAYELDGKLASAPHCSRSEDRNLVPARVETSCGLLFVDLDADAPALDSWMGDAPPWISEANIGALRRGNRSTFTTNANWKFIVENFQESHHFPSIHPSLERLTTTSRAETWMPERGRWLGGTMAIDAETVSLSGKLGGRPRIVTSERPTVFDAMLFPLLLTSLQPDYLLTYRLTPESVDRTSVQADVYFHPAAFAANASFADVVDFWATINAEDRAICEAQQRNARSRAFEPTGYASVEEGVHAFDKMVASIYAEARG